MQQSFSGKINFSPNDYSFFIFGGGGYFLQKMKIARNSQYQKNINYKLRNIQMANVYMVSLFILEEIVKHKSESVPPYLVNTTSISHDN